MKHNSMFLLGLLMFGFSMQSMVLEKHQVQASGNLGEVFLKYDGNDFHVQQNGQPHLVEKWRMDKDLRQVKIENLKRLLENGYISIVQGDDGSFSLRSNGRLLGGGVIGWNVGFWVGKAGVWVGSQLVLGGISLLAGPAAPFVYQGLFMATAPAIETASTAIGVATAIAGGVATGPV